MESASFYKFLDQDKLNNIKGGMFKNNSYMIGVKYYPKAATTNSEFGVNNLKDVCN